MWKLKCQETKICRQREWKLKCQEAKICRQREWKLKFQGGLAHYAPRFCPRQVKLQQSRKLDLSCVEDWFWHRYGSPMLFWQGFACGECNDTTFLRSNYENVIVTNIFHRLQSTSKIGFTSRMLQALLLSLSQLLFDHKLVVFVSRGFVHAIRMVRSFSAMPQYQFFLYCSFRLWKDCCISFDHLNSGFLLNECLYSDAVPYNAPYCKNIKSRNQQKNEGWQLVCVGIWV